MTSRDDLHDSLRTESGRLTRPTDLSRLWTYVEKIELRKNELVWAAKGKRLENGTLLMDGRLARQWSFKRQGAEHDGRDILEEFVSLDKGKDERILHFASTWGVLELCCHNVPRKHAPLGNMPLKLPPRQKGYREDQHLSERALQGREPLEVWRFFARQAGAILRIAGKLQLNKTGDARDWSILLQENLSPGISVDRHWICLADVLNHWLSIGDVRPVIDRRNCQIRWAGADLFGELAVQIALVSCRSSGQVHCFYCGKAYSPKKQIVRGGVNCCSATKCRKRAAAERAARYRRAKVHEDRDTMSMRKMKFRGLYNGRTNDPLFSGS